MTNYSSARSRSALLSAFGSRVAIVLCAASVLILAALVFLPLLGAGFYTDDWTFLALSRHGDGPLGFFVYDHSFTYMYRPVAMTTWWAMTQGFELNPAMHYLFAIGVHGLNSLLVFLLAWRLGAKPVIALLAAGCFLVHPAAAATTSWLADRFDLMMSCGVLAGLLAVSEAPQRPVRAFWLSLPALILAVCSKETGLALVPLLVFGLWAVPERTRAHWLGMVSIVAVGALYFLMRKWVLGSLGGIAVKGGGLGFLVYGTFYWLKHLPGVVIGSGAVAGWGGAILTALAVGVVILFWQSQWRVRVAILQLLALVAMTAVLQAPVTQIILAQENPFHTSVNYRFYYLALAALFVLAALVVGRLVALLSAQRASGDGLRSGLALPGHLILLASAVVVMLAWANAGRDMTQRWKAITADPERVAVEQAAADLAQVLEKQAAAPGAHECMVRLMGAGKMHVDLPGYSDLLVKAHLAQGSPALNCVFATEREPWKAMTLWSAYAAAGDKNLVGLPVGREKSFRSGTLAIHTEMAADADSWPWISYDYRNGVFVEHTSP